jgi:hypothetical protein
METLGAPRAVVQATLRHKRPTVTDVYVDVFEQMRKHVEVLAQKLTEPGVPQSSLKGVRRTPIARGTSKRIPRQRIGSRRAFLWSIRVWGAGCVSIGHSISS